MKFFPALYTGDWGCVGSGRGGGRGHVEGRGGMRG